MIDITHCPYLQTFGSTVQLADIPLPQSITVHCVSKKTTLKNDTDVTHYRFNPHQPISLIFGRDVAESVCYWMVIYYPTSPN